jgi:hypothetical protein
MEQEAFYKDQYDKSLAVRMEINGSLSTPIGVLTALLAGMYFCATNFDYNDDAILSVVFTGIALASATLLITAIINLVLTFADFLQGRNYLILNDADVLDRYYTGLVGFYTNKPPTTPATIESKAKKDFDDYILAELIRNAANNQRINRVKTALLFQSHKFMIYALISLSLLIVPFGIDFGHNRGKDKVQKVKIDQALPVDLTIKYQKDTMEHLYIKSTDHGQATTKHSKTDTTAVARHPRKQH